MTNCTIKKVKNTLEDTAENIKDSTFSNKSEIAKSGKDWVKYIKTHPIQSVFFGIIGYFALKGMCEK